LKSNQQLLHVPQKQLASTPVAGTAQTHSSARRPVRRSARRSARCTGLGPLARRHEVELERSVELLSGRSSATAMYDVTALETAAGQRRGDARGGARGASSVSHSELTSTPPCGRPGGPLRARSPVPRSARTHSAQAVGSAPNTAFAQGWRRWLKAVYPPSDRSAVGTTDTPAADRLESSQSCRSLSALARHSWTSSAARHGVDLANGLPPGKAGHFIDLAPPELHG